MEFKVKRRGIAQSGSPPALGAGCREFESLYPDQIKYVRFCRIFDNALHGPVERFER